MALFQVIKFDGPSHVLVWKYPKADITMGSQLVVGPSQEAVFVRGGSICDVLGPGTHTLNTDNLPLLASLVNLPFGRKTPFPAEVFFVNRLDVLNVKWGTARHIQLQDPVYHIVIPLRAFGQYGVRVVDSARFLEHLVGSGGAYTTQDLTDYFRGAMGSRVVEELSRCLLEEEICFLEANAHLSEIAGRVSGALEPFFTEYGIQLVNFSITSVNAPEDYPSVRKLREVLDRRQEMDLLQFSYQQDRSFDVLEKAAQDLGAGGAAAGVGVGAALGSVLSGMVKEAVQPSAGAGRSAGFCVGCGAALSPGDVFCSKCGKRVREEGPHCPGCGAPVQPGSRFCGKCGRTLDV